MDGRQNKGHRGGKKERVAFLGKPYGEQLGNKQTTQTRRIDSAEQSADRDGQQPDSSRTADSAAQAAE